MARTSRSGAPAATLDDIDNIDIDDMFADDGDELFDGLDIDLDQMGDITNNMESVAAADNVANAMPERAASPSSTTDEFPKRRKTKRKTKSPALFDDEDYEQPESLRKKRRTAKTSTATTSTPTTRKKAAKKEKEEAAKATQEKNKATTTKTKGDKAKAEAKAKAGETAKSKNKLRGSATMPPPLTRPQSSGPPSGIVAAAGQFGGRQKRGMGLPLSRSSSDNKKTKVKTKASAATVMETFPPPSAVDKQKVKKNSAPPSSATSALELASNRTAAKYTPPLPHTTFCGLKPSNTIFYPFLPALPPEPSIKNRKQFPHIDKIFSAFMSFASTTASKAPNGATPAAETEHIFQLMLETMKDINPSSTTPTNNAVATSEKKTSIANAVGSARHIVGSLDKNDLSGDLFNVCHLLKRQYDFLHQNMSNMERWCKDNFSKADYAATYGLPESARQIKEMGSAPGVARPDSILAKFKKPLIKVKLKLNGFRDQQKSLGPLYADLSAAGVGLFAPAAATTGEAKEKKPKKRKPSVMEAPALQTPVPAAKEKEVVVKTYAQLRPTKRRRLISDLVSQTAKDLEIAHIQAVESSSQLIERRHAELKKMIDEDEVVVVHTAAMWKYVEKVGYFTDFTEGKMKDTLRGVWGPEVRSDAANEEGNASRSHRGSDGIIGVGMPRQLSESRKSAFNCLQSLLVENFSDGDTSGADDDDDDEEEEDGDDQSLFHIRVEESMRVLNNYALAGAIDMVDLSNLTVDERTLLHLKTAGLLEEDWIPPESSSISETPESISSRGENDSNIDRGTSDDTGDMLEDIIDGMSLELMELNKVNNARASFLEFGARSHLQTMAQTKSRTEDEVSLHVKCQQLLKRTKDTKVKTTKPKPAATREEYSLPW